MIQYICKTCGILSSNKYNKIRTYCSQACKNKDPEFIKRGNIARKNTWDARYNGHPMKNKIVQQKHTDTMLKKYGVSHALQDQNFLKKAHDLKLSKYGNLNNIEKIKKTKKERYHDSKFNNGKKRTYDSFTQKNIEWEDLEIISFDFNIPIQDQKCKVQCNKCGRTWSVSLANNRKPSCNCSKSYIKTSKGQTEIFTFLKEVAPNLDILLNDRSVLNGHELDIYIPEKKIAIEFNGIFFHSDYFKDRNYHTKKLIMCTVRGITLIQIFDYQWYSSKELIKSMLLSKIGIFDTILMARKCKIKEILPKEKKAFLECNHLSKDARSSVNIALTSNNEVVSVLTFGKPRYNKHFEWEVIRYATKQGTTINGGFSRMLHYFLKTYNPKSIITYANRCWGAGEIYSKNGFKFFDFTPPGYFYFRNLNVFPRTMFQKHKIKDLLTKFDLNLSEADNMLSNGYYRFWDCGNSKFVFWPQKNANK